MALFERAPVLTPEQKARFESHRFDDYLGRFRWGNVGGILLCPAVAWITARAYPDLPAARWAGPPLVTCAIVLLGIGLSYVPSARRHLAIVEIAVGRGAVICIAVLACFTGGYSAPALPMVFAVWVFAALVVPLPPLQTAIWQNADIPIVIIIIQWLAPAPGSPMFFLLCSAGVGGFCILGNHMRLIADARLALAHDELDQLNQKLEQRVAEQVIEIVGRAKQVEALNTQLSAQVVERSRELAAALRRLSERDDPGPQAGDVVGGRVRLERPLGAGGMGRVFLAVDLLTRERVAVKLLRAGMSELSALRRFVDEAAAAAAIPHAGIVKTLHVDVTAEGLTYLLMEYVEGITLARRLEMGPLPAAHVARIGAAVGQALAAAHAAGIIHRDVKPSNLFLCARSPGVRILDFGLCKMIGSAPAGATTLTMADQLMGTPQYMSPEQVRNATAVTPATDVYSLGVVLYQLLAGRLPYRGGSVVDFCRAHLDETPQPLPHSMPAPLVSAIMHCLAKEESARPKAQALADDLVAVADALCAPAVEEIGRLESESIQTLTATHAR